MSQVSSGRGAAERACTKLPVKLVETLLVRDEVDVIAEHLTFHLDAGVDLVVVTDHDSRDGTSQVLHDFARDGYVRVLAETGSLREVEWRTRMARLAAVEHGADWVFNADADQFWWPRSGGLKDALSAIPDRFQEVHVFDRVFVPRPGGDSHFAERMIHRLSSSAAINAPSSTYRPLARVIHRGAPNVSVSRGNHAVVGLGGPAIPHWHPVEVLHFPWRSSEQMARKSRHFVAAGSYHATSYHDVAFRAVVEDRSDAHYARLAVDDGALRRGYAENVIERDTRVRDRLRELGECSTLRPKAQTYALRGSPPFGAELEETSFVAEAAALREAAVVRSQRIADDLECRMRKLEARRSVQSPLRGHG